MSRYLAVAGLTSWLAAAAWATPAAGQAGSQDAMLARVARGKEVYAQRKCQACHSIDGVGSRRSPLDGVGSRLTDDELRLWIVDPRKMRPTVRKPDYRNVPKEDVDALVAYLATLEDE